ncbi:uncharacterized protein LOC135501622 isoform X2 [Lineus longissimus]|uniref:uncharacterized protein LOC135501622 isoform X2 n=1 Tax=Lineus longissimus TaxID=88925 RepID=UPI002B4C9828
MADIEIVPTPQTYNEDLDLPVAVIICIAVSCYVFVVIIALIIKQCLQSRGLCGECRLCGSEDQPCCECCISLGQACNCCQQPRVTSCLDRCCPQRKNLCRNKQFDCIDIILCQCCSSPAPGKEPLCGCNNMSCSCGCTSPECENINCLCFELNMKGERLGDESQAAQQRQF